MKRAVHRRRSRARLDSRHRWKVAVIVALFTLVMAPWAAIRLQTVTDIGPAAGNFDHADAALVLGARVYEDGTPSPFLLERVETGVELYKAGVVDRLIMSGDGADSSGHGEPAVMRALAEGMGVPAYAIVEDPLGVNTYASCLRARDELGAASVIVTTQEFHVSRATWLCQRAGVSTQGAYPPVHIRKGTIIGNTREIAAAAKAWADVVSGRQP
jgi:vancomycin permeability regulator SanA